MKFHDTFILISLYRLALQDPVHRTNPSLTVEQIWDILPDEGRMNVMRDVMI